MELTNLYKQTFNEPLKYFNIFFIAFKYRENVRNSIILSNFVVFFIGYKHSLMIELTFGGYFEVGFFRVRPNKSIGVNRVGLSGSDPHNRPYNIKQKGRVSTRPQKTQLNST